MSSAPDDDDDDILDDDLDGDDDDDGDGDDVDLQEGIFRERRGIFDSKTKGPFDNHSGTTISRETEQSQMFDVPKGQDDDAPVIDKGGNVVPVNAPAQNAVVPAERVQLVARIDKNGNAAVARFKNGKQLEAFHPPSVDEAKTLKQNGRAVTANVGIADVPASTIGGIPWKTILMWGGGLAVVGLGIWWVYKNNKADRDADVDEVD